MMWGNHWMSGGFMWLFWLMVAGVLIILVWWVIRQSQGRSSSGDEDALNILKKRYAQGEIDKKEFLQKKRDILSKD